MIKNDILKAITNFGYLDIERCNNVLDEAGLQDTELVDHLEELASDWRLRTDLDLVGFAYDFILETVRNEIIDKTQKDIFNDLYENVHVAGNYCATSYDYTDNAQKETLELAQAVPNPSKALQWFINQIS